MAVFTKINDAQLSEFLARYDLGVLQSFEGIRQGVENSNYHVFTDKGHYILTLFEGRVNPDDLPFFFAFTEHLNDHGIACPRAYPGRDGQIIGTLAAHPAAIVSFLSGRDVKAQQITPDHCRQVGATLAKMHLAGRNFPLQRTNAMGLPAWERLAGKTRARANEVESGLQELVETEISYLRQHWPREGLPRAAAHLDLFPDNVLFNESQLTGVLDFYFSGTDYMAYDLALVINAWCFDENNELDTERLGALIKAYEAVRPLEPAERENLPLLGRGAAMRILMTRLHDWLYRNPESFVEPKDPREYSAKLRFHRDETINSGNIYGRRLQR